MKQDAKIKQVSDYLGQTPVISGNVALFTKHGKTLSIQLVCGTYLATFTARKINHTEEVGTRCAVNAAILAYKYVNAED